MKKKKKTPRTREEKEKQMQREGKASFLLFILCAAWSILSAYGLSGRCQVRFFGLPLWWLLSVPGLFLIATAGVIFLMKTVFVNFNLDDEQPAPENQEATKETQ